MESDIKLLEHYINGKDGLLHFIEDFLSSYLTSTSSEFHKEIYRLLREKPRLALAAPRSFAKSHMVCVFFALYCIIFKIRKDIVIVSASETLSREWLRKIKLELTTNQGLRTLYYKIYGKFPESPKWAENHIIVSNNVTIRAKGAEAQIRGFRPDLFICDDIESDEGVRSEDRRNHLKEWFQKAVIGTLDPSGQLVIIGTILHFLSLLNHLVEEAGEFGWETRLFRAYNTPTEEEGNETWREKWTHEQLQLRKLEIGSFAFASEYMNNPVPESAAAFKKEYLKYFEELPPCALVQVFDPAYTENETSDYKVVSIIGKDSLGNRYLETYIRTHTPMGDYLNQAINQFKKYRPQKVGVPTGTEKNFYNQVIEIYQRNGCYPVFEEIKNVATTSSGQSVRKKEARIVASLQGLFQAGKYYIRETHHEAREELLSFPAGKHEDVLDTLCGAEQIIQDTYIETEEEKTYAEEQEKKIDRGDTGYGL